MLSKISDTAWPAIGLIVWGVSLLVAASLLQ